MKNKDLKAIYDSQKLKFHSGFRESMMLVSMIDDWQGQEVLEIGCGHGNLASILNYAGANVLAMDYSVKNIEIATNCYQLPRLEFRCGSIDDVRDWWDVIVMQGVLEHLDEPWKELERLMLFIRPGGCACLSVPNWVNPRGYVYHTLRLICDAKMTLTDLHFFLPQDFKDFAKDNDYKLQFYHTDKSWAAGPEMIADFEDRLPKALENVSHENIDKLLKYLSNMLPDIPDGPGATLGVKIST